MPEIIIIVAIASNGVIGRQGKLPWHLPTDLRLFKQTTLGFPLVMGRKTYDSIGKPLPGRENIILTRDTSLKIPGCVCVHSLEEALEHCRAQEKVFIIGGAEIFKVAIPYTDTIIATELEREVEGDVYFPEIDYSEFVKASSQDYDVEEPFSVVRYTRKRDD